MNMSTWRAVRPFVKLFVTTLCGSIAANEILSHLLPESVEQHCKCEKTDDDIIDEDDAL